MRDRTCTDAAHKSANSLTMKQTMRNTITHILIEGTKRERKNACGKVSLRLRLSSQKDARDAPSEAGQRRGGEGRRGGGGVRWMAAMGALALLVCRRLLGSHPATVARCAVPFSLPHLHKHVVRRIPRSTYEPTHPERDCTTAAGGGRRRARRAASMVSYFARSSALPCIALASPRVRCVSS